MDGGEAGGRFEVRLVRPRHDTKSGALGDFAERHPRRDVATVQLPSRRLIVVVRVSEAEREHEAVRITMKAGGLRVGRLDHARRDGVHQPRAAHQHARHHAQNLGVPAMRPGGEDGTAAAGGGAQVELLVGLRAIVGIPDVGLGRALLVVAIERRWRLLLGLQPGVQIPQQRADQRLAEAYVYSRPGRTSGGGRRKGGRGRLQRGRGRGSAQPRSTR